MNQMEYDRITLGRLAKEQGFVRDTLEKVCRLTDILLFMQQDGLLSGRLALKGGTAINLTVFDLPRLSVDIDLDYAGDVGREQMMEDRGRIRDQIGKHMAAAGYLPSLKSKQYHALDSFVYEYQNAGGMKDNLKIEINYMLRRHVLDVDRRMIGMLTEEEIQTYNEEVKPIAAKLSQIETGNGNYLPGELVSTEVIADLEGMRLMLDLAKQEEGFDYDAFFRASAKFFFDYRAGDDNAPDAGTGYVDSHPPYYVRINFCVAHFDEFYQTYPAVKEGAPMYIAPEDRVMPW